MRLLIVEDDPHIAELLSDGLTEEGYECDRAGSAAEGGELALPGHPARLRQVYVTEPGRTEGVRSTAQAPRPSTRMR